MNFNLNVSCKNHKVQSWSRRSQTGFRVSLTSNSCQGNFPLR